MPMPSASSNRSSDREVIFPALHVLGAQMAKQARHTVDTRRPIE